MAALSQPRCLRGISSQDTGDYPTAKNHRIFFSSKISTPQCTNIQFIRQNEMPPYLKCLTKQSTVMGK